MKPSRRYPVFYEKAIPVILVFIGLIVLVLVGIILGVVSGFIITGH